MKALMTALFLSSAVFAGAANADSWTFDGTGMIKAESKISWSFEG